MDGDSFSVIGLAEVLACNQRGEGDLAGVAKRGIDLAVGKEAHRDDISAAGAGGNDAAVRLDHQPADHVACSIGGQDGDAAIAKVAVEAPLGR